RARWYDPKTGDFTTEDPDGFGAGQANLGEYVGNHPTNGSDPSGLFEMFGQTYLMPWDSGARWDVGMNFASHARDYVADHGTQLIESGADAGASAMMAGGGYVYSQTQAAGQAISDWGNSASSALSSWWSSAAPTMKSINDTAVNVLG